MTAKNGVTKRTAFVAACLLFSLFTKGQLVPDFSATPLAGCSPLIVSFTDLTTGNPTQWRWDLGNATVSTTQNPSTTYFNPGTYTVKLVVRNASGADSITKLQYITVYAKPAVSFTGVPAFGCVPLLVQFNSQSTAGSGTIASWQWDFGDGTFATVENPSHTYTASGNFNVSLRVTNSFGCVTTVTKLQYIQVGSKVHADFTNSQPTSCDLPTTITFQNNSTGAGSLAYQWDFGDGGTSIQQNPSHTYATAGSFTVRLIVISSNGCRDTLTKVNAVTIGVITASFTNPDIICENTPALFTNTSAPVPSSVAWDFGDATTSTAISPVKVYTTAGFYQVRMIAKFGNCADTAYRSIIVRPQPQAGFTGSPLSACKPPLNVTFTDQSVNGASYQWDFGDGGTSTQQNPTHTYTQYGNYTVQLIVTNSLGCSDTIVRNNYIHIQAPQATINGLPVKDCAPLTHTFTATVNSLDAVVGYQWDFGDGGTSTLPNPTHIFAAGVYTITLIVTTAGGCTDTVVVEKGITASIKPHADFVAAPRDVCAHTPVNFTDLSTGTVTTWLWAFGDGGTSTQQNPAHMYEDTGYFSVQLIVWNEGCPDTIKFDNYIHIKPPIANFISGFVCTNKLTRVFTDKSIGADEWNWDFGDGNTSTQQSPTHVYATPGTYTVTLLVRNHTTGCEYTKTLQVKVVIEKANFTESATVICRKSSITFTSTGNNLANVASFSWNYGDGGTGTSATTTHVYNTSGTYTVRLILTDILGCKDTLIKPLYIRVDGPVAAFAPGSTGNCTQSATVFNDNSTGDGTHPITTWIWNFGDGNTTTFNAPPFFHNYTTPGTYDVILKVIDSKGCIDSIKHAASVIISKPLAKFATPDSLSCPGKTINFTNSSTGPNLTYKWDFGDAATSTATNPTHQYTIDGNYTVQLIVTDKYGCTDTTVRLVKIATPFAAFSMSDSVSTCPPLVVYFTNNSANAIAVNWDFGDGTSTQSDNPSHFYSYPGTYNVKLTVTSNGGCTSDLTKQVIVSGPKGNFTYAPLNGCSPLTVKFIATTENRQSFVWDFNDGNISPTNDSIVTYTYREFGNYVPKMILIDAGGCQVPITGLDTIHVKGVVANFGFLSPTLCDKGSVAFSDSSKTNDVISGYQWDFGDGGTSTQQNPTHFYTAPGLYFPQLIVTTQSGCTDTVIRQTPVKIVASPQADIINTPNGCAPLTVTFNGSLLVADTSAVTWSWDLGNGNTSTLQNPPAQLYTNPTTYNIQLIVTNSSGCKDTVPRIIEAYRVPVVNAGNDIMVCRGSGIPLLASGADNYTWTPSTGLSCNNCPNPVASPADTTQYIVTGTTIHGCSNIDTIIVNVKQPFTMLNGPGDTLCKGGSLRLYASGAYTYAWSPSAGLSNTTSSSPIASPTVSTTYRVIGTDDKGCFRDTAYIAIKVYPIPTVDGGPDKTINVGQSVTLTPTISSDVVNVFWSPTTGTVSSNYPSVTVQPKETTTYMVEATNGGGCKSRDNVTVFVLCNGANFFIPNTFSPNGDGANDVFYPRGTGLFNIKSFRIFNRWGEIVFEKGGFAANDASAGWDGTFKGVKLNPDVYVYTAEILCDNQNVLILKGNVALIR
jgi:gliding motility-associated-like protein